MNAAETEGLETERNLERRLQELDQIVKNLEDGNCPISEAIRLYSEGMALALECRKDLNTLTRQVATAREEAIAAFNRLEQQEKAEAAARQNQSFNNNPQPQPSQFPQMGPNGNTYGQNAKGINNQMGVPQEQLPW